LPAKTEPPFVNGNMLAVLENGEANMNPDPKPLFMVGKPTPPVSVVNGVEIVPPTVWA
jgi:hypothetical protein